MICTFSQKTHHYLIGNRKGDGGGVGRSGLSIGGRRGSTGDPLSAMLTSGRGDVAQPPIHTCPGWRLIVVSPSQSLPCWTRNATKAGPRALGLWAARSSHTRQELIFT